MLALTVSYVKGAVDEDGDEGKGSRGLWKGGMLPLNDAAPPPFPCPKTKGDSPEGPPLTGFVRCGRGGDDAVVRGDRLDAGRRKGDGELLGLPLEGLAEG